MEWVVNTGTRTVVGDTARSGVSRNLPYLVDQLHLLAGVAAVVKLVDVRDEVEGDLMEEILGGDGFPACPR
jgi:hypothetical protein